MGCSSSNTQDKYNKQNLRPLERNKKQTYDNTAHTPQCTNQDNAHTEGQPQQTNQRNEDKHIDVSETEHNVPV